MRLLLDIGVIAAAIFALGILIFLTVIWAPEQMDRRHEAQEGN